MKSCHAVMNTIKCNQCKEGQSEESALIFTRMYDLII